MQISHELLSRDALNGLIDEFITRDSDFSDGSLDVKRQRVLHALESQRALIVVNEKDGTTNILTAEEYAASQDEQDP
ncbi:MAG: YheU family protein [Gammaproteobacteria bacterium]|nr:YheU family protein [Gammaproteobacteria bacterium]